MPPDRAAELGIAGDCIDDGGNALSFRLCQRARGLQDVGHARHAGIEPIADDALALAGLIHRRASDLLTSACGLEAPDRGGDLDADTCAHIVGVGGGARLGMAGCS
jgi:hypothetical protein